ncbi:MAG: hypothetical protein ACXABY_03215 [Candidatus Thorarchaeota archaeon]|jgi:transposase-like protein
MAGKDRCPYCSSSRVVFRGYRYNEKSEKRLRLCKACKRKFTPRDRFWRMRFGAEEIAEALSLRKRGFSSSEAQKHLARKGIKVSRWTILKWAKKYNKEK